MKERLKKTPFYKFKERKLKKQIDSMTNAESQAALDLAKKEEKEAEAQETREEGGADLLKLNVVLNLNLTRSHAGGPQQEDDRRRDAGITEAASPHPLSRADIQKKARIFMSSVPTSAVDGHAVQAEQRWMDDYVAALVGAEEAAMEASGRAATEGRCGRCAS